MLFIVFILVVSVGVSIAVPLQELTDIDITDLMSERTRKQIDSSGYFEIDNMDNDNNLYDDEIRPVSAAQVSPIISGMLGQLGTAIQPLLGPLAPLSSILGPLITSTVTDLVTSLLNRVAQSANRNDLSKINGYNSYVVDIPNQGQYILLSKSQANSRPSENRQPQPTETDQDLFAGTLEEFLTRRPADSGMSSYGGYGSNSKYGAGYGGGQVYKKPHPSHKHKIKKHKKKLHYVVSYKDFDKERSFGDNDNNSLFSNYNYE